MKGEPDSSRTTRSTHSGDREVVGDERGDRIEAEGVERGTVRTNGIETYYERRGDGPPVVFVHAAIMDHSMWAPQVAALADEFTTVVYDLRGHGRTGGSDLETYSVDLYAEDLDALVTALDLDRPVLCGLSTGGCIAQVYAARYPEKLSGLVLADTWTPELLDWRDRVQFAALRATVLPVRLLGFPRVQRWMTWFQGRFLSRGARGDYETVERIQAEMPEVSTDEFAKVVRSLAGFTDVDVDYSAITVPTLVLYGENTVGTVKRHVPKLAAGIPAATVREVPGGGHASNLDDPGFFSAAVRDLVREATSAD